MDTFCDSEDSSQDVRMANTPIEILKDAGFDPTALDLLLLKYYVLYVQLHYSEEPVPVPAQDSYTF